jgi:hypothetical protein
MYKTRSVTPRFLIVAGVPAAAGLVIMLFGVGLLPMLLAVSALAALLWYFTREPRPEGELPCASVSCRHYLGDDEEEHK